MDAPLNGAGTSATASRSRNAANSIMTMEKPNPETVNDRLNKSWFSLMLSRATPKTAQLVVIKGRKIPSKRYSVGLVLWPSQ